MSSYITNISNSIIMALSGHLPANPKLSDLQKQLARAFFISSQSSDSMIKAPEYIYRRYGQQLALTQRLLTDIFDLVMSTDLITAGELHLDGSRASELLEVSLNKLQDSMYPWVMWDITKDYREPVDYQKLFNDYMENN